MTDQFQKVRMGAVYLERHWLYLNVSTIWNPWPKKSCSSGVHDDDDDDDDDDEDIDSVDGM